MSRRRRPFQSQDFEVSREEVLARQARRHRRRGEYRRAMVVLREACQLSADDPKLWALYGIACFRMRKLGEAEQALGQALYLRSRARDDRRVRVLRRLIDALQDGGSADALRAA